MERNLVSELALDSINNVNNSENLKIILDKAKEIILLMNKEQNENSSTYEKLKSSLISNCPKDCTKEERQNLLEELDMLDANNQLKFNDYTQGFFKLQEYCLTVANAINRKYQKS